MPVSPHRKNKVSLSDFNYDREIETRLFFANLSTVELPLLREIVDDSLKISLTEFSKRMKISLKGLQPFLKKLETVKFLKQEGDFLIVDKEQRKSFESFLVKFDEDFEPGMEYLKSLLAKIPIPVQTQWYHLPRTADNIFQALVESLFSTPKVYTQYIEQLEYENPLLGIIVKELYATPDLTLSVSKLMQEHQLTPEEFHAIALLLEYNLVCCVVYRPKGEGWVEQITPFAEWKTYLTFLQDTTLKPLTGKIKRFHNDDFGFIIDLSAFLKELLKSPVGAKSDDPYHQEIIDRALFHHLVKEVDGKVIARESATAWLQKTLEERALSMSRHPTAVEKGLLRVIRTGWVYVEDFLKGFTGVLSGKEKITLRNKGKKWGYFHPEYSEEEWDLIRTTLCKRLFEAGFIAMGELQGKPCFCVTPFGRKFLEE